MWLTFIILIRFYVFQNVSIVFTFFLPGVNCTKLLGLEYLTFAQIFATICSLDKILQQTA